MMNVQAMIDSICEARRDVIFAHVPKLSTKYGVGCPPVPNEDPFTTWVKKFLSETPLKGDFAETAQDDPEQFIQMLIDRFDALFILVVDDTISVFSRRKQIKRPPQEFLDKVENMLHIWPDDDVGWYKAINAQPENTVAAEAIYGMPPEDVESEKTRPKMSKALGREEITRLRKKFWGKGGYDPSTASDIVDKIVGS